MMRALCAATLLLWPATAAGGEAHVIDVAVAVEPAGTYRFDVTVHHEDTGWDHYVDAWDVVAPDGAVLATRVLAHPHVDDQPFTRSLGGIEIPDEIERVTIRARDTVHLYGGATVVVERCALRDNC